MDEQLILWSAEHPSLASPLNRGDVIEVQGPPASGKTQLTYHLVMNCVLPRELLLTAVDGRDSDSVMHQRIEIGGWERGAVVLDCDGRWNVARLKQMLFSRFLDAHQKLKGSQLVSSVEELVEGCLKRVHIFKPKSTTSMACTILHLPTYHALCMPTLEIALLVIDSVSAFYWQDRLLVEQQRNVAEKKDASYPMNRFLTALQDFRLTYGTAILMTNWGLSPLSKQATVWMTQQLPNSTATLEAQQDAPSPFYRQHLHPFPAPFEFPARVQVNAHLYPPITHHITLSLPMLPHIPPETQNLAEAEEKQKRCCSGEVLGMIRFVSSGMTGDFTMNVGSNGITS